MPILTATPALDDLAARLQATGLDVPSRTRLGSPDAAFAFTSGLPSIVARYVRSVTVDGTGYTALEVAPSGTPAAVAEGGTKPTLATLSTRTISLVKYAGMASVSTERAIQTDAAVQAIKHVLTQQVVKAFDEDTIAELVANAGATGSGSTWSAAILDGIAAVVGNGGNPDTLIMSGADYAAAVESPGAGYLLSPTDGVATLFGLRIGLSVGAAAGEAFVLDSSAVTCGDGGAYAVVDPYSNLSTNAIAVAVEGFMSAHVSAPGAVAALTVA